MTAIGCRRPGHVMMQQSEVFAQQAVDLRLQGLTYERIADKLECSIEGARQAVLRGLARMRTESAEKASEMREIECARLERIDENLSDMEARAPDEDTRLAIIDRRLRVADRRAKLLGLDLARLEVTGAGGGPIQITGIQRVIVDPTTTTIDVTPERPALAPPENDACVRHDDASNESKADSGTYDADVAPVTIVR